MSSPISTSSRQAPIAPPRPATPARPQSTVGRPQGDRLELGRALSPSLIEADLRLSAVGDTRFAADGKVTLQKAFLDRLLRHALGGSKEISEARFGFDAASGSYTVQAKIALKGLSIPLSLKVAPLIDQNQLSFQFRDVAIPTRLGSLELNLITRKLTEAISQEMRYNGFANTPDAKAGIIRIDTNSILGRLGVLPAFASLDFAKTRLSMTTADNGNLVVGMQSAQRAAELPNTPASDIAVYADEKALQAALRHALGPDFDVEKVTLRDGGLKLDGEAEFKQGSDVLNAGKALLLILAIAARDPAANRIGTNAERFMVPLALDVKQEGTELVITPSLSKALGALTESIQKAGFSPVVDSKSLRIDLNELLKGKEAALDDLRLQADGASARMRLDIDSLIDAPWLKADPKA